MNVIKSKTKKQYNIIIKLIKQADHVCIATDCDREGEVIAREMLDAAKFSGEITRLWLFALDDTSIQRALSTIRPGADTKNLYDAGLARSRCDWLVGMNLTRLYSLKAQKAGYDGVLSVGRVQTPTLRMVVDRDLLIENFVPVDYWEVVAEFPRSDGEIDSFFGKWIPPVSVSNEEGQCIDQQAANTLWERINGTNTRAEISSFEKVRKKQNAPLPFSLDSLTSFCDKSFGLGAKQVLDVAQSLYETHKVTSYPRSDCDYLPLSQLQDVDSILSHLKKVPGLENPVSNANQSIQSRVWNDSKITAHHAIIPTTVAADISTMSVIEQKVYDAICRRYIAQFYPPHEYDQTVILLNITGETFKASGRVSIVSGWKDVLGKGIDEKGKESEQSLPQFSRGDETVVLSADVVYKKTNPPSRYTEGTLSAAMKNIAKEITDPQLKKVLKETTGIGTVATRPAIFEVLLKRALLTKKGKNLISSDAGRSLINALPEAVKSPGTTAMWEQSLEMIAEGKVSMDDFIRSQKGWIEKVVTHEVSNTNNMAIKATAKHQCPTCNDTLRRIKGSKGFFWGCSNRECKYTAPDSRGKPGKKTAVVDSNYECPKCSKKLRQLKGNKGKFWGCTGFKEGCKFTAQDRSGKPVL
ncbi:UNVERIFIED_CONTAM: hypothetical protein GTU68_002207 [Idotea baltica]|nr:hypothetical protein [Idotea baltica]